MWLYIGGFCTYCGRVFGGRLSQNWTHTQKTKPAKLMWAAHLEVKQRYIAWAIPFLLCAWTDTAICCRYHAFCFCSFCCLSFRLIASALLLHNFLCAGFTRFRIKLDLFNELSAGAAGGYAMRHFSGIFISPNVNPFAFEAINKRWYCLRWIFAIFFVFSKKQKRI